MDAALFRSPTCGDCGFAPMNRWQLNDQQPDVLVAACPGCGSLWLLDRAAVSRIYRAPGEPSSSPAAHPTAVGSV